jgi:hypothetical protein
MRDERDERGRSLEREREMEIRSIENGVVLGERNLVIQFSFCVIYAAFYLSVAILYSRNQGCTRGSTPSRELNAGSSPTRPSSGILSRRRNCRLTAIICLRTIRQSCMILA